MCLPFIIVMVVFDIHRRSVFQIPGLDIVQALSVFKTPPKYLQDMGHGNENAQPEACNTIGENSAPQCPNPSIPKPAKMLPHNKQCSSTTTNGQMQRWHLSSWLLIPRKAKYQGDPLLNPQLYSIWLILCWLGCRGWCVHVQWSQFCNWVVQYSVPAVSLSGSCINRICVEGGLDHHVLPSSSIAAYN